MTQAEYELKKYEQLVNDKATVQARLNQLAHYIFPRKYNIDINGENTTTDLPTDVYDGTAIYSLKVLAAGLSSYLTNPASKWFTLEAPHGIDSKVVKDWLQRLQVEVYRLFSESNFYQAMPEMYKTLGAFGSGVLYSEEEKDTGTFYQAFDVMNCAFETDDKNRVVGLYRDFYYTALQCLIAYGEDNLPDVIKISLEKNDNKRFNILHVVRKRRKYEEGKVDIKNKPFASTHYLIQTKDVLKESGFDRFPYNVARFETNTNDPYGYGPAEDALPDIKSLNQAVYDWHESVQRANNPIVVFPSDSYGAPEGLLPGDIIFKQGGDPKEKIETIASGNPNITIEMLKDIRARIQQSFFVDLFLAISNETKRMTIPELQEKIAEKMGILGTALHSLVNELLKPAVQDAVDRVIKLRRIEEAPKELQRINILFVGPLARAQRNSDAEAIRNWVATVQGMSQTPQLEGALDVINAVNASRDLADVYGVPSDDINSKEEVDAIQEARLQAQQEAMQAQQQSQQIADAEGMSKAKKNLG